MHEAVVTQAHAKRHCLLPRLAITLKWNKKERALGGLAPRGLGEAGEKLTTTPSTEAPQEQGFVSVLVTAEPSQSPNMFLFVINKPQTRILYFIVFAINKLCIV